MRRGGGGEARGADEADAGRGGSAKAYRGTRDEIGPGYGDGRPPNCGTAAGCHRRDVGRRRCGGVGEAGCKSCALVIGIGDHHVDRAGSVRRCSGGEACAADEADAGRGGPTEVDRSARYEIGPGYDDRRPAANRTAAGRHSGYRGRGSGVAEPVCDCSALAVRIGDHHVYRAGGVCRGGDSETRAADEADADCGGASEADRGARHEIGPGYGDGCPAGIRSVRRCYAADGRGRTGRLRLKGRHLHGPGTGGGKCSCGVVAAGGGDYAVLGDVQICRGNDP